MTYGVDSLYNSRQGLQASEEDLEEAIKYLSPQDQQAFRSIMMPSNLHTLIDCAKNSYLLATYPLEELVNRMAWMKSFRIQTTPHEDFRFYVEYHYDSEGCYLTESDLIQKIEENGIPKLSLGTFDSDNVVYNDTTRVLEYEKIPSITDFADSLTRKERKALIKYLHYNCEQTLLEALYNARFKVESQGH